MTVKNAFTVDVEDYFQVSAFNNTISPSDWNSQESRIEYSMERVLTLLAETEVKATFFVLGWVAARYPDLIKRIAVGGHEIASHGYSHQLVYSQSRETFKQETLRSKKLLEDIVQKPVNGYRAASYSITNQSEWALDELIDAGFKYDSSIFPVHHDRYGWPGAPTQVHRLTREKGSLIEFPLSTVSLMGYRLPVAGGGYFRLYHYLLSRMLLRLSLRQTNQPFIFYLHPWEIDPDQPRINAKLLSRFRHYNNLSKCESRLKNLLRDFEFTTVNNVLIDIAESGEIPRVRYS